MSRYRIYMGYRDADKDGIMTELTMPEYWDKVEDAQEWLDEMVLIYKGLQS